MICINCLHGKTDVYNSRSRSSKGEVWRRRRCQQCGFTFTTSEITDIAGIYKVSAGKQASPFSPAKLILSLLQVLEYSSQPTDDAFWLAQTVQQKLIRVHRPAQQLVPNDIASICLDTLQQYNAVAALAYATRHGLKTRRPGRPSKVLS